MLTPLSKKHTLRCTECLATCHKDCASSVPHFCGLSAELIDSVRYAIEATDKLRKNRIEKSLVSNPRESVSNSPHLSKLASRPSRKESMRLGSGPKGIGLDDFKLLAVLGKGNFGKVMLVEEIYTRQHYAIKVLKKDFIIENDEVER